MKLFDTIPVLHEELWRILFETQIYAIAYKKSREEKFPDEGAHIKNALYHDIVNTLP